MEVSGYVRGVPTYADLNGKTYGMLCETKEKCITDDTGVALDFKLEELRKQTDSVGNSVTGMVNGTQKVGNADKLDGHDSSYFATAASVTNITNGTMQVGNAKTLGGNTSDAFAKKTDLAKYLPLDGSKDITSRLKMLVDGNNPATFTFENSAHSVQVGIASEGDFVAWDYTLGEALWRIKPNGTKTFNGTASGNLPLSGNAIVTGVLGATRASTNGRATLEKNNSTTADYGLQLRDITADNKEARLEISAKNNHFRYVDVSGNTNTILHTGNSAKVIISETAPSDTSALWVW